MKTNQIDAKSSIFVIAMIWCLVQLMRTAVFTALAINLCLGIFHRIREGVSNLVHSKGYLSNEW